jgi:hypothetical protein
MCRATCIFRAGPCLVLKGVAADWLCNARASQERFASGGDALRKPAGSHFNGGGLGLGTRFNTMVRFM